MRVQEIMTTPVVTIGPDEPASDAWSRMQKKRIRHLVVTEGSRLLGVISDRDLGGRGGASVRRNRTVRDLMTPEAATVTPGATLRQAANLMRGRLVGSLPVIEDERVVGIVTATDVLDELGRGSTRPAVRAQRQGMRVPPAGARSATRKKAASARARRSAKRRGGKGSGDDGDRPPDVPVTGRITPELGRDRPRTPDTPRRAPLAKQVSRAEKRHVDPATAAGTPAYIRAVGAPVDAADRDYLRRKLGRKLGKFEPAVERASVRIEDVNGPRGGIDKRCRIKVVLRGLPSVVVEERHETLQAAMDGALARVERAVRRATERRRTKPLKAVR